MPLPPIHRWDDVARPRAAVHVVHGMGEHGRRYARFAAALNAAGMVVWAHDHRGHGERPELRGHFADRDGWRLVVEDTWAVSSEMRSRFGALPLVMFAHSMGSFAGQTLMGEHGDAYRGVMLSGTNGPPGLNEASVRLTARVFKGVWGERTPGTLLDKLVLGNYNKRFAPNRTDFDWLSRDEREVDAFISDPLCGAPLTWQSWSDFLDGQPKLGTPEHLQRIPKALPTRIIAGSADPVGEQSKGLQRLMRVYREAGLTNVGLELYEGARHELVNETNRDDVTRDVIAWLNSIL
jgi:alpha-beta hydrolase superfamily lysophospholipase